MWRRIFTPQIHGSDTLCSEFSLAVAIVVAAYELNLNQDCDGYICDTSSLILHFINRLTVHTRVYHMYYIAVLVHSKRKKEFYSPDRKRSGLFLLPKEQAEKIYAN